MGSVADPEGPFTSFEGPSVRFPDGVAELAADLPRIAAATSRMETK